jgi:hypothetical protein
MGSRRERADLVIGDENNRIASKRLWFPILAPRQTTEACFAFDLGKIERQVVELVVG